MICSDEEIVSLKMDEFFERCSWAEINHNARCHGNSGQQSGSDRGFLEGINDSWISFVIQSHGALVGRKQTEQSGRSSQVDRKLDDMKRDGFLK